jgi:hypothetical protein
VSYLLLLSAVSPAHSTGRLSLLPQQLLLAAAVLQSYTPGGRPTLLLLPLLLLATHLLLLLLLLLTFRPQPLQQLRQMQQHLMRRLYMLQLLLPPQLTVQHA